MLERLTEVFCEVDDFCKAFQAQRKTYLLGSAAAPPNRGVQTDPRPGSRHQAAATADQKSTGQTVWG